MEELIFETTEENYNKIRRIFAGLTFHRITPDKKFLIMPIGIKTHSILKNWLAAQTI